MTIKNILVAVDGEINAMGTVKYAICLSKNFGAQLNIIYVINKKSIDFLLKHKIFVELEAKQYEEDLYTFGKSFLERVKKIAEIKGVKINSYLSKGIVHEEIINKAIEISADLIVIGGPGAKHLSSEEFYDEGTIIIWKSPCTVISVKNYPFVEKCYNEI